MDFLSRFVGSARGPFISAYDVTESPNNNNNNNINNDNGAHALIAMTATPTVFSGGSSHSFSSSSIVPVALSANKPEITSRSENQHNRGCGLLGTHVAVKSPYFAGAPQKYTSPDNDNTIKAWQSPSMNENYSSRHCCFSSGGGGGAQTGVAGGLRTPSLSLSLSPALSFSPPTTLKHRLKPRSTSPQQTTMRQHPNTGNSNGGQNSYTILPPSLGLGLYSMQQHANVDETPRHAASSFIPNKHQAHREPNLGRPTDSSNLNTGITVCDNNNGNRKGTDSNEHQNNLLLALGYESFAASCSFENPSMSNQCPHEFEGDAPPQGVTTASSQGRGGLSDAAASTSVSPSSFFLFQTHPAPPHCSSQQDVFNTGLRNDHHHVHHQHQQQKRGQRGEQQEQRQKTIQYVFDGPLGDDREEATFHQLYQKCDNERSAIGSISTSTTSYISSAQTPAGLAVPNGFTTLVTPTLTPTATAKRRTRSRAAIASDPSTTPLLGTSPSTLHHSLILAHAQPMMNPNNISMNNSLLPVFLPKNSFASIVISDDENNIQRVNSDHNNDSPTTHCCFEGACLRFLRPQQGTRLTLLAARWCRCASFLLNKSHFAPKIRFLLSKLRYHTMCAGISPTAASTSASSATLVRGEKCSPQKSSPQHHTLLRRRRFAFFSVLLVAVFICTVFIAGETLRFTTSSVLNGAESEKEGGGTYSMLIAPHESDENIFGASSVGKRNGGITLRKSQGGLLQLEKLLSLVRDAQDNNNDQNLMIIDDSQQGNESPAIVPLPRSILPSRPSSNHRLIRVPGLTDPTIVAAFMYDEMMRIHSSGPSSAADGEKNNKNAEHSLNKDEMNSNNDADNKKRADHYSFSLPTFPLGSIEAYLEDSDSEVDQKEEKTSDNNNSKCDFGGFSSSPCDRGTPLVIDLVYTYVNPSSPSFTRDMEERQARKAIPLSEWEIIKKKRTDEEVRKHRENLFIEAFNGLSSLHGNTKGNEQKEGDDESRELFTVELESFLTLADLLLENNSTKAINDNSTSRNFLLREVRELARRKIPNVFEDLSSSRKAISLPSDNFGSVAVGDKNKNEAIRSQKDTFTEARRLKTLYRQYLSLFNDTKEKQRLGASAQNRLGRQRLLSVAHEVEKALTELSERYELENEEEMTIDGKDQNKRAIKILKARVDTALRRLELAENMSESLLAKLGLLRQVGKSSKKQVAGEGEAVQQQVLPTNSIGTTKSNIPRQYKSRKSYSHQMIRKRKSKISANGGLLDSSVTDQQRYRDWNEILYSLRGVYQNLILGGGDKAHVSKNNGTSEHRKTVRNIYIVVADRDQAPEWLKTGGELPRRKFNTNGEEGFLSSSKKLETLHKPDSKEKRTNIDSNNSFDLKDKEEEDFIKRIIIVEHKDIVPNHLQSAVLPTFNSYIIESLLHRIPGLAPHYIYFNNDMLLARPVSFFDFFQPFVFSTTATTTATTIGTEKVHATGGKTNSQPVVNQTVEVRWLPIVFSNAIEKFSGYARRDPIVRNQMDILRAAFGWGGRRGDLPGRNNARVPYDFSPPFLSYSHAPHLIERDLMGRLMEGKRYGQPIVLSSPVSSDEPNNNNNNNNTSYFFTNAHEEAWKSEDLASTDNSDEDLVAKKVREMLYDENNRNNGLRNANENVFPVFLYNHYQMLKRFQGDYVAASKALVDGGRYQAKTLNSAFTHSYTNTESGSRSGGGSGILGMMNRNFFAQHQFGSDGHFVPLAYPQQEDRRQQEEKNTDSHSTDDIFGNVYGLQTRHFSTTTFKSRRCVSESDNEGTKEIHVTLKRESQRETLFSYLLTLANNKIRAEAEAKLKQEKIGSGVGQQQEEPSKKQPTLGTTITGAKSTSAATATTTPPATTYDGKTILLVEVLRIVRSMFENFDSGAQYPSQLLNVGKEISSSSLRSSYPALLLDNLHGGGVLCSSCDSRSVGEYNISTQTAGKSIAATADGEGNNEASLPLFDGGCAPIFLNVQKSPQSLKEATHSGGAAAGRKRSHLQKESANSIDGDNILAIMPRYLMSAANPPSRVANVSSSSSPASINDGVNADHLAHFVDFPRINFRARPTRNVRGSYDHWLLPLLDVFAGHHMTLTSAVKYYFGMMTSTTSTATYNDVIGRRGDVLFLTINDDMDSSGPAMGADVPPPHAAEIIHNGDFKKINNVEPELINNPALRHQHDIRSPRRKEGFGSSSLINESKTNELHDDICQALEDENSNEKNSLNLHADSNAFGSRRALLAYYPINPQQRPAEEILDEEALARDNNMPQNELVGAAGQKIQRLASVRRVGNKLFFEKEANLDSPKRHNFAFKNALNELVAAGGARMNTNAHPRGDERLVVFGNNKNNDNEPNRAEFLNRHHDGSNNNNINHYGNDRSQKRWDHLYLPRSELPSFRRPESNRDDESVKIARFERKALVQALTPLRIVDSALVGAMAIIAAGGTLRNDVLHDKFLTPAAFHSSQNGIREGGGREIQLVARKALKDMDARRPNDEGTIDATKIRLFCLSEIVTNKAVELEAKTRSLMCKARRRYQKDLKSSVSFETSNAETHMVVTENTLNDGGAADELLSPRGASELVRIYSAFAPAIPAPWEDQNLP